MVQLGQALQLHKFHHKSRLLHGLLHSGRLMLGRGMAELAQVWWQRGTRSCRSVPWLPKGELFLPLPLPPQLLLLQACFQRWCGTARSCCAALRRVPAGAVPNVVGPETAGGTDPAPAESCCRSRLAESLSLGPALCYSACVYACHIARSACCVGCTLATPTSCKL